MRPDSFITLLWGCGGSDDRSIHKKNPTKYSPVSGIPPIKPHIYVHVNVAVECQFKAPPTFMNL